MTTPDRNQLRATFGEVAAHYDRCRPGYPSPIFDELAAIAPAGPGTRVLEIGAGTGKATVPLARLGCDIVAVELSAALAALAEDHLAGFPAARVEVAAFEDWPLPGDPFDVVVSATAFHWIDPEVRMTKAADALRPGGALAVISTEHVAGGTEPFFAEVQEFYERFDPSTPPGLRLIASADLPTDSAEFDESRRFGPVEFRRHEWDLTYTSAGYIDLLLTYSGHLALPPDRREGLLTAIANLIDTGYGGRITKRFLTQLAITHRAS